MLYPKGVGMDEKVEGLIMLSPLFLMFAFAIIMTMAYLGVTMFTVSLALFLLSALGLVIYFCSSGESSSGGPDI